MEFLTKDDKARAERVYLSAAEFSVNPGFHRNLTTAPSHVYEHRLRGYVAIPDIVMDHLKVPDQFPSRGA